MSGQSPTQTNRDGVLAFLPHDVATPLMSRACAHRYGRGQTIVCQGDVSDSVFVALDGWIKVTRLAETGTEAIIACLTTGGSFGETSVLGSGPLAVSAEAVTDCSVLAIRAEILRELMAGRSDVMKSVMRLVDRNMRSMVLQIEHLKTRSAAQRLAAFILGLCPAQQGSCRVRLPFEKIVIAGQLGMQPESLSRAIVKLKAVGVRVEGGIATVPEVGRLRLYTESDRADSWRVAV